jgi:tetratricopeptide (TPR) repeat protein
MLLELAILKDIRLKNWDKANKGILSLTNLNNNNNKANYYRGLVHFSAKDYKKAAMNFEAFLSNQKDQSIFDPMDLAKLINNYADSLYNLGEFGKFQKVTDAILADTKSYAPNNPFIKSMRERLNYLSIEITAGKLTTKNALLVEAKVKKFFEQYPQTDYKSRLSYLLGMSLAKNNKRAEARKLYEGMLGDQEVPASIKELVRSELSLMAIKERTI